MSFVNPINYKLRWICLPILHCVKIQKKEYLYETEIMNCLQFTFVITLITIIFYVLLPELKVKSHYRKPLKRTNSLSLYFFKPFKRWEWGVAVFSRLSNQKQAWCLK